MEKINIAQLLKDCPKGMELDCTMYDNCTYAGIEDVGYIDILINTPSGRIRLTKEGCYIRHDDNAKCVIFPKGKTSWEGFVPPCNFKDGDIVATENGSWIGITEGGKNNRFIPTYCVIKECGNFEAYLDRKESWQFHRLATEEEKQKLFDAIKANGYKWNPETKTLDKLPKFKVGDRIQEHKAKDRKDNIYTITKIDDVRYHIKGCPYRYTLPIAIQDRYVLAPTKFDITTLKPFESKVLVRSSMDGLWKPAVFGFRNGYNDNAFYIVGGSCWKQCIPYLNNEHLCGTTDDCDDFYKTWE